MPDTQRTLADILVLLADNTTGDISPQDLRDAVVSLQADHGEISLTASVETPITTVDVWVEALEGTHALTSALSNNFSMSTDGRMAYGGTETRVFHVAGSFSMLSAGNNKIYEVACGVNGVVNTQSTVRRLIATGADVGSSAFHALVSLDPTDYLSFMVRNTTDAANLTFTTKNLFAMGMIM